MSRRSRARQVVLQVLYEDDLNPDRNLHEADAFLQKRLRFDQPLIEFARSLLAGVRRHRPQIDQMLAEVATNWSVQRMTPTDRNALRLGAFEILYAETPAPVAINEAVELARRFGDENSGQFINGILDRLLKSRAKDKVEPSAFE